MYRWKVYAGPKLVDVVPADTKEEAAAKIKSISERAARIHIEYDGIASPLMWAPFLADIPKEIWEGVA